LALDLYSRALSLDPSLETPILLARGNIYASQDQWDVAIQLADQILARDPNHWDALNLKRKCVHLLDSAEEDVALLRRLVELKPDPQMHSRLLFNMLYAQGTTAEAVYDESRRWFQLHAAKLSRQIQPHRNDPDPNRKIKIGYVSPDLRFHTIMKLLPAVFENHDHNRFDLFFYSLSSLKDPVSEYVAKTNRIVNVEPDAAVIAAQARADGIDILVDLAGHTMEASAHLVFALKPAPVQVSWLGAVSTTGMPTIDYYIGDAQSPCPGTDHLFVETVYRLPRVPCSYRPVADIGIAESPFFQNGYITFGSFNDPRKITRDVVKLWSVLLHMTPQSKLFLKYHHLEKPVAQERFRRWFLEDGIPAERLRFAGPSSALDYLCAWGEVDIGLDPFPYNGGTTTMDALWMGVPVVTLAGRLAVARTGASLLSAVGLPVAETPEQYLSTAMFLVDNIPKNPDIRKNVRHAMAHSPLMDEKGLVRTLEAAYRDMWKKWCEQRNGIKN
jgi:predicted O-linked N-acetylglucosamine transferase (SPINDLY family)